MPSLAESLKELRERAGWSQRELARRMGVGVATVSSVEAGRDPRLSTLRKFAEHLPGATARVLLAPDSTEPEPVCRAAWESNAEFFGFVAERASVQAGEGDWSLEIEGIHGLKKASPALEVGWLGGVCLGSPLFLREFDPPHPEARFVDGEDVHEFRWRAEGLEYSFRSEVSRECAFEVEYPVEELTLSAPAPPESERAVLQVFAPDGARDSDADIARLLHPTGAAVRSVGGSERVEVTIACPLVGFRYVLGSRSGPPPAGERRAGEAIAGARRAHGFSLRELAARSRLTHRGVLRVEEGVDPKAETLRALLTALPQLAPQELLPTAQPPTVIGAREEWDRRAACVGMAAAEYVKVVDLGASGERTTRLHTRGLQSLRRGQTDLQLRVGLRRTLFHSQPDLLLKLETDDEDMTWRPLESEGVPGEHELNFRGKGAATRFNYIRTYRAAGGFLLTAEQAGALTSRPGPHRAGASIPVRLPMRRCRLVVIFPEGYEPIDVLGHVWPNCFVADESLMLDDGLRRLPVKTGRRGSRLTLEVSVRRPVVGLAYSISWELP